MLEWNKMNVEIKIVGNNTAKIQIEHFDAFEDLRSHFSTIEKNFGYIRACRSRGLKVQSGKEYIKKSCIKMNGEFELGLLFDILTFCKNNFYNRTVSLILDEASKEYIKSNNLKLDLDVFVNESGAKPRDYQIEAMQLALNKQNGIYILGTGAGKTLCTALLIHNLLRNKLTKKILVICPFPDLANQTFNEISINLKKYKYKINKWFGGFDFDKSAQVIIAGSNILRSQYAKYKKDLLKFNCVIVDEVHQLKANNKISTIIKELPAKFRYGFTGTLPDDKHDVWSLKGKIGPVRYNLPSAELRSNKFLTPVKALGLRVTLDDIPKFIVNDDGSQRPFLYSDEVDWLSDNNKFNEIITKIAGSLENNTLILINRLQHGENLLELCQKRLSNKKVYYIQGEVSLEERGDIKKQMEDCNNLVVIAQVATFSTGINVKNIHNIIFPGLIGKSTVRIVQSVGRGLRLNQNKAQLSLIDIIPNTKYCLKHIDARKEIYSREKIPYTERLLNL